VGVGQGEAGEHRDLGAELFFEFSVSCFYGLDEDRILGPVVEGGAVDFEFRGDGGNLKSKAEGDGGGGLDGGQIGVEICRIRRLRRVGGVSHTAPRMEGARGAITGPTLQVIQKVGEIKFN